MTKYMQAAVLREPGIIEMEKRQIPVPKANEVLIKVKHVGICGSDIHYYQHGKIGDFVVEKPLILGHECAGEVVAKGEKVQGLNIGQKIAVEPGIPCGVCEYCKTGQYNLCPDVVFLATPPYDGAFTEYLAYPEHMVFKLPEGMNTMEGALVEPLAVGFHAALQGKARTSQSAVVLGSGAIGLVTMMALKAMGVTKVYVTDLIPERLEKARSLGADAAIKAGDTDVIEAVMELTEGKGVDLVLETAGSKITTQQTTSLVKRGGRVVLVGMSPEGILPVDIGKLMSKEASIHTVFRYRNLYPTAIEAVASGLIPLSEIVTNVFKFEETVEAIKYVSTNQKDVVKGVIEF